MENYISDPGYQSSLLYAIEDKMIFNKVCFENPVFSAVELVEHLWSIPIIETATYEGCKHTVTILLKKTNSKAFKVNDTFTNKIVPIVCGAIAATIADGEFQNSIIEEKVKTNPGMTITDGYNWLFGYLTNPSRFSTFFKVFKIPDESAGEAFTISFV